MLITSPHQ